MLLSLLKLNTQFLSLKDYLLRNFRLFALKSAYKIFGDVVNMVKRMRLILKRRVHRPGRRCGGGAGILKS